MSARKSDADEPPSPQTAEPQPPARVAAIKRTGTSPARKGRRGRLSHDDYAKAVAKVLRADLFELEDCALLGQLPGVRALAKTCTRRGVFPTGSAIRAMLDRAVGEVELLALNQRDNARNASRGSCASGTRRATRSSPSLRSSSSAAPTSPTQSSRGPSSWWPSTSSNSPGG